VQELQRGSTLRHMSLCLSRLDKCYKACNAENAVVVDITSTVSQKPTPKFVLAQSASLRGIYVVRECGGSLVKLSPCTQLADDTRRGDA